MRFGYWTPLFGGWLRNVDNENMPVTFDYVKRLAQRAERIGFDLTLVPELNLNDIKGTAAPSLEAWSLAAAIAATTERLEIMAAMRPGYHLPAVTAKQAATIDDISCGRFTFNVVSAWWAEEAKQYGGIFSEHDDRYKRTAEFVEVMKGLWRETPYSFSGEYYDIENAHLEPKPRVTPRIYAGGESEAGKAAITGYADAYLTHGGTAPELRAKIDEMKRRRVDAGLPPFEAFGMAAYVIVRETEEEAQAEFARITDVQHGTAYESYQDFISKSQLEHVPSLEDYSVSNRGLRPGFVGTPSQVAARIKEFEDAGVDTLLLQFSPQLEEMDRFGEQVIPLVRPTAPTTPTAAGVSEPVS
ncbi:MULTISPECIES: LLM class flavin-dependent oxidoreductase [Curtobacterium]|uniref:LLM class flavin-dependent oxidoreductase n=1 Tax=Curtobacterium TaxID=2034 RepID=UPI00037A1AEF|nr:LLM class flavin-dependent oxidoreductase [Curtobacterium flaccumfaciens]EYT65579.1 alkanesulfonate monooxygenase [Curtobacterium flaccumfaciens UCD-AKU]MBT1619726.1 LLM class flavin-dependent oxidoreductase [Curtobacterium flaccumfaciens pv. poinsettiae]MCS6566410.1 LLM class flavin-dependent oxidoreductase [Curtobacterium flaccumfaciens pv. flaccumfaciens]MCS6578789.1 LLM class flavin-dependent oxidoreductase [Curtobacterium flaccumfaciens]MCU0113470.1 LLM class flavin-dependent oxidoredu